MRSLQQEGQTKSPAWTRALTSKEQSQVVLVALQARDDCRPNDVAANVEKMNTGFETCIRAHIHMEGAFPSGSDAEKGPPSCLVLTNWA